MLNTSPNSQDTKLIYVGDPMCSWCYGFGPEWQKVEAAFPNMEKEIVLGGLRPYNDQSMQELGDFLRGHWEEIHDFTGQAFNYEILESEELVYDTEPPCRAVMVVREMDPKKTTAFFGLIQRTFYFDNLDLSAVENYRGPCLELGIDFKAFKANFESDAAMERVKADFKRAADLGVTGFPTLLLQKGKKIQVISVGYSPFDQLKSKIETQL